MSATEKEVARRRRKSGQRISRLRKRFAEGLGIPCERQNFLKTKPLACGCWRCRRPRYQRAFCK